MRTRITDILGIKYPIVEGGMQWIGTADLAAAVSNAGGLGMLTARLHRDGDHLRSEISRTRSLTDKPFAVNISISQHGAPKDYDQWIRAVIDGGVRIVETAGNSPRNLLPVLKAQDRKSVV